MKKLVAPLIVTALLLPGCGPSQPASSPTPEIGPRWARGNFCRDWNDPETSWILGKPVETLGGAGDADAFDKMVAVFESDARMIREAGDDLTATRVEALADAFSALADDVGASPAPSGSPSPTSTEAPGKGNQDVAGRRAELLQAVADAAAPLQGMCVWFAQRENKRH